MNLKAGDGLTTDFTDSTDGRGGTPGPPVPNGPRPGWAHGRGDMSQPPLFPAPLRLCGKRPPLPPHPTAASLRHEPQGSLLSHRWNRRVEIGSSSRPDATVRTCRLAALLGPTTICQMDRSDPIAPLSHETFRCLKEVRAKPRGREGMKAGVTTTAATGTTFLFPRASAPLRETPPTGRQWGQICPFGSAAKPLSGQFQPHQITLRGNQSVL